MTSDEKLATKNMEASAVSIKLPQFWTDKPDMWFYQVEAQFRICIIVAEDTKFYTSWLSWIRDSRTPSGTLKFSSEQVHR